MAAVKRSCKIPTATWLPAKNSGSGQFHIICPMDRYINTRRKPIEAYSLCFNAGVTVSFNRSSASDSYGFAPDFFSPLRYALYPAFSTAFIISSGKTSPSTPMEFVRRLTEQDATPGTFSTAFSTLALQAAQLIPVTVYCSIMLHLYFINFCSVASSSSTVSSFPSLISRITQVLI